MTLNQKIRAVAKAHGMPRLPMIDVCEIADLVYWGVMTEDQCLASVAAMAQDENHEPFYLART